MSTKPSNPKDIVGSSKLPLSLVPDCPEEALAFLEGALKYGRFNWRVAGVRASIYGDAVRRHLIKWWNGESCDSKTRVRHLASIIACCKILLDAERCGKLVDDRPPVNPLEDSIDALEKVAAHLRELFKDYNPKQYTIEGYCMKLQEDAAVIAPDAAPEEPLNYPLCYRPVGSGGGACLRRAGHAGLCSLYSD